VAQGIDHDIANEMDGFAGAALFEEVVDGILFGDKEIVGDGVGEDAVDLFGHGAVEAAEAGFDVGDANAEFDSSEGDGDGGIDVPDDENEMGLVLEKHGFDALKDFGRLGGVGAGTDLEIDVRRGDAHLLEEDVGEFFVVVLARVDEDGLDLGMALHFAHEGSDFGEVGARSDDIEDFYLLAHGVRESDGESEV
jgi:hypothetical protein